MKRIALGLSYSGQAYEGYQSQRSGKTIQDVLEKALFEFTRQPVRTVCAGRTDARVHALQQVVHFDIDIERSEPSWIRGTNRFLPHDVAIQWARVMPQSFHARQSALTRRYLYVLSNSPIRPSWQHQRVGWCFAPLDLSAMQEALQSLLGTHDFTSFRAAQCQAPSPIKTLLNANIQALQSTHNHRYFYFEFEANAFLHHMIRNIMGCLVHIGQGDKPATWMLEVLQARSRQVAAPTFAPDGLYFLGPTYAAEHEIEPVQSVHLGLI